MPADKTKRQYSQLVEASSIGLMFPIAIGLGYLWGLGMDKLFGTAPWLSYVFAGFGVIAAFINLFRITKESDGTTGTDPGEPPPHGDGGASGIDDRES
ncbi:MAG: AtpZ/AtpI family protein [Gemmatimonadaceae bacterium]